MVWRYPYFREPPYVLCYMMQGSAQGDWNMRWVFINPSFFWIFWIDVLNLFINPSFYWTKFDSMSIFWIFQSCWKPLKPALTGPEACTPHVVQYRPLRCACCILTRTTAPRDVWSLVVHGFSQGEMVGGMQVMSSIVIVWDSNNCGYYMTQVESASDLSIL